MAAKGVTRSGEAYCLSCHQMVERSAAKCEGCLSELTEEVKAFPCPKCKTVMALGSPQCPTCGLRFKVKAIRQPEQPKDDQFLMKLIEWGKAPPGQAPNEPEPGPTPAIEVKPSEPVTPTPLAPKVSERGEKLSALKDSIRDLMDNRAEMLRRMEERLEVEKKRLAGMSVDTEASSDAPEIEAEIMSLADEMADITMLQAQMEALSGEISTLLDSAEVSGEAKERGLAARALKKKLEAKEREVEELRAKEEQLVKREEMVDRKIQAYAQKKKELDEREADLQSRLRKLEDDKGELERLRTLSEGAASSSERDQAMRDWIEQEKKVKLKLMGMRATITTHRTGSKPTPAEMESAEADIDAVVAQLEEQIGVLITEKVDLQAKSKDAIVLDEDLKKLLKVLDQMLGQLPEDVIEQFSKSEAFALYERVLDRFKI